MAAFVNCLFRRPQAAGAVQAGRPQAARTVAALRHGRTQAARSQAGLLRGGPGTAPARQSPPPAGQGANVVNPAIAHLRRSAMRDSHLLGAS